MYTFHRSISNIMFCMQNLLGGSLSNSIVTGRKLINSKLYNYTILSCTMHTRINAVNASTHKSIQSRIDNSRRKEKMLVRNVYIHFLSSINAKFMLHARYLSTCVNEKKTCENNHSPFPFQFPEHDSWHVWLWPFSSREHMMHYARIFMLYPYNLDDWYQLATDNACLTNAGLEFLRCLGFPEKLDVALLSIIWPGVSLIWFFLHFSINWASYT